MNYQDFACPKCTHHPLRREGDFLQCPACQTRYPIRGSVPLLFPSEELSVVVDGHTVTLHETRDVYDRAYCCDGLMGTCLDETYDRVTKGILLQFASLHSAMRLLDLGTGVGQLWDCVPTDVIGYAIDPSVVGVTRALQRCPCLTACASVGEHLPFPCTFFDAVISADTIEHTFSPQQTLAEVRRVLKPGGTFALSVPVPNSLRKWGWNQIITCHLHPGFLFQLAWVVLQRFWLFGNANFQPIDRDLNVKDWLESIERAGFAIRQSLEWPDPPQTPIVYLLHTERS